mgnify:CR=1 FL=1|jgi:hypothetical protein
MGEIIERHSNEVHELQLHKTDNIKFEVHLESVDDKLGNMKEYVEKTRNMVIGCENYLEKYQPLFNHRQISEAMDHVVGGTSVKLKWKLKKFSEMKCNHYIEKILYDRGVPDLDALVDRTKANLQRGKYDDSQAVLPNNESFLKKGEREGSVSENEDDKSKNSKGFKTNLN